MRFRLYREYGALNSGPIFDIVQEGLTSLGHKIVDRDEDIPVIWSVLWHGRMSMNKTVYNSARKQNKPVLIIEVGNFFRGRTWRLSLNHINKLGFFANKDNLDHDRPKKLGIQLQLEEKNRKPHILIAAQHDKSLQWEGQPSLIDWSMSTIKKIRQYSDRPIIIRPHPRCKFSLNQQNTVIEIPKHVPGTYDDFNIDYKFHCVVNHNSGPAIQAALAGVPIICDSSSLAYPVSTTIENIEKPQIFDRDLWLVQLSHTEWTVEEIKQGIPFQRILINS